MGQRATGDRKQGRRYDLEDFCKGCLGRRVSLSCLYLLKLTLKGKLKLREDRASWYWEIGKEGQEGGGICTSISKLSLEEEVSLKGFCTGVGVMWVVPRCSVGYASRGISTGQSSCVGQRWCRHGASSWGGGLKPNGPFLTLSSITRLEKSCNKSLLVKGRGVCFVLFFNLLFSLTVHPVLLACRVVVRPASGLFFHPESRGQTFQSYCFILRCFYRNRRIVCCVNTIYHW